MTDDFDDVRMLKECPCTYDSDGFMHDDMSCATRNTFTLLPHVNISHEIIIAPGRHDGTITDNNHDRDVRRTAVDDCLYRSLRVNVAACPPLALQYVLYRLNWKNKVVPIDAAGLLWQCAFKHASDFLAGNFVPALIEFAHHLNFKRSICLWECWLFFDGMPNVEKRYEDDRRRQKREKANDDYGRIKISPEYVAMAMRVAKLMNIKAYVSKEEADPQVSYVSMTKGLIPVTGDSDLLAYGVSKEEGKGKLVVVQSYEQMWYRVIDLEADTEPGQYPLFDLYKKHGRITFQLYAGCRGCDFTEKRCGISGIGFEAFITIASTVEGDLNAHNFSHALWSSDTTQRIALNNELTTVEEVEGYLQRVVDIYANATVYDKDSNITSMEGERIDVATDKTRQHMTGMVHPKTQMQYTAEVKKTMEELESTQFLNLTATNQSTIRGAQLPDGKKAAQCTVSELRDFVAAHGGNTTGRKAELVVRAEQLHFINEQSPKSLFDRNPNPNGLMYANVDASGERSVREILQELHQASSLVDEDNDTHDLIKLTYIGVIGAGCRLPVAGYIPVRLVVDVSVTCGPA